MSEDLTDHTDPEHGGPDGRCVDCTPEQVDTELADLWQTANRAAQRIQDYTKTVEDERQRGRSEDDFYVRQYLEKIEEYRRAYGAARVAARPGEALYEAQRWSRFFLVTNGNGHVHSSMECTTCFATTQFAWLPELSGKSEHEAVEAYGESMCTVCFPSAPTDPAWIRAAKDREQAEAKKAEGRCPGSGTYDHGSEGASYYIRWAVCTHCGRRQSITSTGKLRAHKKEDAS